MLKCLAITVNSQTNYIQIFGNNCGIPKQNMLKCLAITVKLATKSVLLLTITVEITDFFAFLEYNFNEENICAEFFFQCCLPKLKF